MRQSSTLLNWLHTKLKPNPVWILVEMEGEKSVDEAKASGEEALVEAGENSVIEAARSGQAG